jgi:outer membrane protein TolC
MFSIRPARCAAALVLGVGATAACIASPASTAYSNLTRHADLTRDWERAAGADGARDVTERSLAGASPLERDALVRLVLERNPTLRAARYAWRAALERFPQVTSLDDPTLDMGAAPLSFGSDEVGNAPGVDLRQKLPFPGKLALRGRIALAEAEAAAHDFEAVRLELATTASLVFDEYSLATRSLALTAEHVALVSELRRVTGARYASGEGAQVDLLQAELQLTHARHRELILESRIRVSVQRLNVLLRRRPDAPLPPPSSWAVPRSDVLPADVLVEGVLEARPELQAAHAHVRARRAAVDVARREFFPDVTLVTAYNAQWQEKDLRPWIGMQIHLPVRLERRRAALAEAEAELARAESERAAMEDEVRGALQTSAERLTEASRILELLESRLLPAARDQVAAARAAFEAGQSSFAVLIDAAIDLLDVELGVEDARAALSGRSAELARARGHVPGFGR